VNLSKESADGPEVTLEETTPTVKLRFPLLPITPELAFQAAANHAAAASSGLPAYVSYQVKTHISIPSVHRERDIDDQITTRLSDDESVIQETGKGTRRSHHPFPVAPAFDSLSDFSYDYGMNFHKIWFEVTSLRPRTYREQIISDADVTARSLRDYRVRYAPDSSNDQHGITHLIMTPYTWYRARGTYFFHQVWIDNATSLPTRVEFDGIHNLHMAYDYSILGGKWVVNHAHLEQDMPAPFHIGKVHFYADADFSGTVFSNTTTIPELVATTPGSH
jgi:hypothetical protein